jgi:hypothetical protein
MPANKIQQADVATFADYEVITPHHALAKAISRLPSDAPEEDPVSRAEQALSTLACEFGTWMDSESERLDRARKAMRRPDGDQDNLRLLYHASHDIKGEAATFGYPLVAPAAESLCRLIEESTDSSRIPFTLVDQHVNAIRAIVREYARPDIEKMAGDLAERLRAVVTDFLAKQVGQSPPLVPSA